MRGGVVENHQESAKIRQTLNKRWKYVKINRCRLNPTSKIINVIDAIGHLNFGNFFFFSYLFNNSLAVLHEKGLSAKQKVYLKVYLGVTSERGLSVTCTEVSLSEQQTI